MGSTISSGKCKVKRIKHSDDALNASANDSKTKRDKIAKRKAKTMKKLNELNEPTPPKVLTKLDTSTDLLNHPENFDYDELTKDLMRKQLSEESYMFILNQLLLSIQFFGNYEREMYDGTLRNSQYEQTETEKLTEHCKSVILPDRLHEAVDWRVKFQCRRGPNKKKLMPIHQQTMYIVHENIEITNPGEQYVYSKIMNGPVNYKFEMNLPNVSGDSDLAHTGYVRLKNLEPIKKTIDIDDQLSSADSEEVELPKLKHRNSISLLHHKVKENLETNQRLSINQRSSSVQQMAMQSSTQSLSTPSSSEYDYAYTTALHQHRPLSTASLLHISNSEEPLNTIALPDCVISNVSLPSVEGDNDDDDEEEHSYEVTQFINSKEFLSYFLTVFTETFADTLQIPEQHLKNSTWKGPVIYTTPWKIIPAIVGPWPREAFEWYQRFRNITEHPMTGQKFQWPAPAMVNKVRALGCHLVPYGYVSKYELNPIRELEWKIVFPEAERYLESCLTNAQVKVYMAAKILIKTFLESDVDCTQKKSCKHCKMRMFTTEHLRAHLFWQCENNYAAWSEICLGQSLKKFLDSLLMCIKKGKLKDYFMPDRNLLEHIPSDVLIELHTKIYRITENPVMYMMIALRNLKYCKDFYPKLNYKKLYYAIVIDDAIKIKNTNLLTRDDFDLDLESDEELNPIPVGFFEKQQKPKRTYSRKVQFTEPNNKTKKSNDKRESIELINEKFYITPHMEKTRRTLIFEIFIEHFIEMAECSAQKFLTFNQANIYLEQAQRLCELLKEDDRPVDKYLADIKRTRVDLELKQKNANSTKPELPLRKNSYQYTNRSQLPKKIPPYENESVIKSALKKQLHTTNAYTPDSFDVEASDDSPLTTPQSKRKSRYQKSECNGNAIISPSLRRRLQTVTDIQIHSNNTSPTSGARKRNHNRIRLKSQSSVEEIDENHNHIIKSTKTLTLNLNKIEIMDEQPAITQMSPALIDHYRKQSFFIDDVSDDDDINIKL